MDVVAFGVGFGGIVEPCEEGGEGGGGRAGKGVRGCLRLRLGGMALEVAARLQRAAALRTATRSLRRNRIALRRIWRGKILNFASSGTGVVLEYGSVFNGVGVLVEGRLFVQMVLIFCSVFLPS